MAKPTSNAHELILGLDPGGKGNFGWVLLAFSKNPPLNLLASGVGDHAESAVDNALKEADRLGGEIVIAGIDAPLCWVAGAEREADRRLRKERNKVGGHGVMHVNSLSGACLAQGMMAAKMIEDKAISIVEAHPGSIEDIISYKNELETYLSKVILALPKRDHERDAALSALAAWVWYTKQPNWVDLTQKYPNEGQSFTLLKDVVPYMMPTIESD
ncbi:MAG: DUF429 domain-containing protein [SAR324 cluster bacterium]|nr:DUF429 domain-containing protein [SAR324 cluster bacterium]